MEKFFKAFLLVVCAMIISTVLTGCTKEPNGSQVIERKDDMLKVYVRIYDEANDENIDKDFSFSDEKNEILARDVVDIYKSEYSAVNSKNEEEAEIMKLELPRIDARINDSVAIVSFDKILTNMGSSSESNFINNLAYSLQKSLNIKGMYLDVNGSEYASGHLVFDKNQLITQ